MIAYAVVKTAQNDDTWPERFSEGKHSIPEIVETHRMARDTDYLWKVVAGDIA